MFKGCSSLISLPYISQWNTENINNMSSLFGGCLSLKSLPDISKWNMANINNISGMFKGCSSLILLSDISLWNTENISNMAGLFEGCSSLKSLPDISKWNLKKIYNISGLFKGCSSLVSLPDISKWNTEHINNISGLFKGCSSLKSLPDISKWNISNLYDYRLILDGCTSLKSFPDISKIIKKNVFNLTIVGNYQPLPEIKLERSIKIFLYGESGVGCNMLSNISIGKKFDNYNPAVNCFSPLTLLFFVNFKESIVELWNGPGQEKYRPLFKFFLRGTDILIFVYDIIRKRSFEYLNSIFKMAKDILGNKFIDAFVANKSDLNFKEDDVEEGKLFVKEKNYKFYLVSAKDNPQKFINCLDELVKDYILAVHPDLLT